MGPGHLGLGLAGKPLAHKVPLWGLLVASEALDLLCEGFAVAGVEKFSVTQTDIYQGVTVLNPGSVPWSHGLFMSVVWSVVAAAIAVLFLRDRRASVIVGLVVFSHWGLDFIVHPQGVPLLFDGSPMIGLGLWASGPGLVISGVLEVALLAGGMAIYLVNRKRTPALASERERPK